MLLLSSAECFFFFKLTFSPKKIKKIQEHYLSVKQFGPRHSVGPDLDPDCLQRLSADDKSCGKQQERVKIVLVWSYEIPVVVN